MSKKDRVRRPIPPRKKPKRDVLGALYQSEPPRAGTFDTPVRPEPMHPLGPGFGGESYAEPNGSPLSDSARDYINASVRDASDLIDEHIRLGSETLKAINGDTNGSPFLKPDLSAMLTSLVRAYSDAASVWVDIVGSLVQNLEGANRGVAGTEKTPAVHSPVGIRIRSKGSIEAGIEMFRESQGFRVQPLVAADGTVSQQIGDVRFEPSSGDGSGRIVVNVPDDQPAGTYHGLLISTDDRTPVGVLTLQVSPSPESGSEP